MGSSDENLTVLSSKFFSVFDSCLTPSFSRPGFLIMYVCLRMDCVVSLSCYVVSPAINRILSSHFSERAAFSFSSISSILLLLMGISCLVSRHGLTSHSCLNLSQNNFLIRYLRTQNTIWSNSLVSLCHQPSDILITHLRTQFCLSFVSSRLARNRIWPSSVSEWTLCSPFSNCLFNDKKNP